MTSQFAHLDVYLSPEHVKKSVFCFLSSSYCKGRDPEGVLGFTREWGVGYNPCSGKVWFFTEGHTSWPYHIESLVHEGRMRRGLCVYGGSASSADPTWQFSGSEELEAFLYDRFCEFKLQTTCLVKAANALEQAREYRLSGDIANALLEEGYASQQINGIPGSSDLLAVWESSLEDSPIDLWEEEGFRIPLDLV